MLFNRFVLVSSLLSSLSIAAGCDGGAELVIDLRTDLSPGVEFVSARTEVYDLVDGVPNYDTVRIRPTEVTRESDFHDGGRIAEVADLEAGDYLIEIVLLDARESVVASKTVRAAVAGSFGITAVITRDCRGVTCPDVGGSALATSCLSGRCVDAECIEGSEESCPEAECGTDSECVAAVPCAAGRCTNGVCLFDEVPGACEEGDWCNPEGGCQPLPGMATADCTPVVETCNTLDDDCDEAVDEGFDFSIDITNCGACGAACAVDNGMPRCEAGVCAVAGCNAGYGDCDASGTTGCEQPLDTLAHCGACGAACSLDEAVASCQTRSCAVASCRPGFEDCNGVAADGCEVDLGGTANCGGCGVRCPESAPLCAATAGSFACATGCPPGLPTICEGSCVDTATDVRFCGGCGTACTTAAGTPGCVGGACVVESCDAGYDDCNGVVADGCEQELVVFYRDMDRDDFGDPMRPSAPACSAPPGYVVDATDCDDADMAVGGIMPESCNDADDDCDGLIDEGLYGIRGSVVIANPGGLRTSDVPPDIAWSGSELAVVWSVDMGGGAREDLVFARRAPTLSAIGPAQIISDQVENARDGVVEYLNSRWFVAYTRGPGGGPVAVWAIVDPVVFPPTFQRFGPSGRVASSTVMNDGGTRVAAVTSHLGTSLVVGRFDQGAGFREDATVFGGPTLGGAGIAWDPSGVLVHGVHVGTSGSEALSLYLTPDRPPYSEAGSETALTPPSRNGGPVHIEVSGARMVTATSAQPGGGPYASFVVAGSAGLGGAMVTSGSGRYVSLGQSTANETYGLTVDGTFRMATFEGTPNGPGIALPAASSHATIGGNIGGFRYVVAALEGTEGVRLFGLGCL